MYVKKNRIPAANDDMLAEKSKSAEYTKMSFEVCRYICFKLVNRFKLRYILALLGLTLSSYLLLVVVQCCLCAI